ncbi:MAG: Pyrimidine dimer DNA glycosylase [bacterium ADurb.Bin400]|nr:MAG: Pyrimidine dimer DNA glycosylase [bacterium ADurb.Bin400]
MRIWDLSPKYLCREHLLGEHRELHAIWEILTEGRRGYRNHPEVKRWEGKLAALYLRHEDEVKEMMSRGYKHKSPLDVSRATGSSDQDTMINTIEEQKELLRSKGCDCG